LIFHRKSEIAKGQGGNGSQDNGIVRIGRAQGQQQIKVLSRKTSRFSMKI
jgi:hypothetical protein